MTHYKHEGEVNGYEVTVQQVRGPDSDVGASEPSAWIDGWAVYLSVLEENPEIVPEEFQPDDLMAVDDVRKVVSYLVDNGLLICKKCNSTYPVENAVGTGFAGNKCGECASNDAECPDSPDGEHHDECTNPRHKHNARMPTKYKCKHCGRKRQTVATG
jgi:uncharacterized protein YbaR (Trm112 family)